VVWHPELDTFLYPFIFISDSGWTVDVCTQVPQGYDIAGVYDENGVLTATSECAQAFVAGETKVIAFEVEMTGSPPEWAMNTKIKAKGPNGKSQNVDIAVKSKASEHASERAKEKAKGVPFITGFLTFLSSLFGF